MKASKEDIFKKKISYCLGCKNPKTFSTTVENALTDIENGKYFKKIRDLRASLSSDEKKKMCVAWLCFWR